jgi:DNA-binding NarL/FixJ family response regulator
LTVAAGTNDEQAFSALIGASGARPLLEPRQWDVVKLSALGLCCKTIAGELKLSPKTVAHHLTGSAEKRRGISHKLGFHDPARLAHVAILTGLVKLGECLPFYNLAGTSDETLKTRALAPVEKRPVAGTRQAVRSRLSRELTMKDCVKIAEDSLLRELQPHGRDACSRPKRGGCFARIEDVRWVKRLVQALVYRRGGRGMLVKPLAARHRWIQKLFLEGNFWEKSVDEAVSELKPGNAKEAADDLLVQLSPRQVEIVVLTGSGMGRNEIAARLKISRKAVDFYLNNSDNDFSIQRKLGFCDPARLAHFAILSGLIKLGECLPRAILEVLPPNKISKSFIQRGLSQTSSQTRDSAVYAFVS